MSDCWRANPKMRPAFTVLSQALGKLVEAETPNKYINLDDAPPLYPVEDTDIEDMETETRESESEGSGGTSEAANAGTTSAGDVQD